MPTRTKILWIEDSARFELSELAGPVYFARKYLLTLAEDATSAMHSLASQTYDAVIVDIRLPPGNDQAWQRLYQNSGRDKTKAQLGMRIIEWLLSSDGTVRNYLPTPPPLVPAEKIAVFTAESWSEVGEELSQMGVRVFQQKTISLPDTILLNLIQKILGSDMIQ